MSKNDLDLPMVWMDLEMTGLDDQTCTIVQIATIITDSSLNELAHKDIVVWQPESSLESMVPIVRKMHTDNGLLDRIRASDTSLDQAESATLSMVQEHVPYRRGILAGNTIWQDRRFLIRYMPLLEKFLHYRMVDVSSIKLLAGAWYKHKKDAPAKRSSHTALEDIRQSIEELKHYREHVFVKGE